MIKYIIIRIFQRRLKEIGQITQDQKAGKRHLKAINLGLWTPRPQLVPLCILHLLVVPYTMNALSHGLGAEPHTMQGRPVAAGTEA